MKCPHCGSPLLWSDDRGDHCDGCDEYESGQGVKAEASTAPFGSGRRGAASERMALDRKTAKDFVSIIVAFAKHLAKASVEPNK